MNRAILVKEGVLLRSQDLLNQAYADAGGSANFGLSACFTSCLGDGDSMSMGQKLIPYYDILNAVQLSDPFSDPQGDSSDSSTAAAAAAAAAHIDVEISYVHSNKPTKIKVTLDTSSGLGAYSANEQQEDLVEYILKKSYPYDTNTDENRKKLKLVIINPHGGKGSAKTLFHKYAYPILLESRNFNRNNLEIVYTQYGKHAIDIARNVDLTRYDTIICASGDGIPYEVINGLYKRDDRAEAFAQLAVTQLPCGSGNAMSLSSFHTSKVSKAALALCKAKPAKIDLMCFTQTNSPEAHLSFLSQTYGVIAEGDINTEFIRWMGPARFDLGVAFNVLQNKKYPCDIYVKHSEDRDGDNNNNNNNPQEVNLARDLAPKYPIQKGVPEDWIKLDDELTSNLNIFYTGKMPYIAANTKFFPHAKHNDGKIDLIITSAKTPIPKLASILLSLDKGTHVLQPEVYHEKVVALKIIPRLPNNTKSIFSIDGERYPLEPLQVEILPQVCKTFLKDGQYFR